jgi:MFS family permease
VSDRAGRKRIVLRAMAMAALSTGIYFFATSTPWLFVARVLSGFSIGLAAGAVAVLTRAFDSLVADSMFAITLAVLALGALAASLRMPTVRIP